MSCYLCERWNWSRVFNLDFSAFSVIFSASLTKKNLQMSGGRSYSYSTQVEKDNKQKRKTDSRTPVHAKIEVAAGEVDPHRLKISFTVEVFTFYLGWGLCVSESFIFEHRAFVVSHVESAVTEPHVNLEHKGGGQKKMSLLVVFYYLGVRRPPPPLVVPWAIKILSPYSNVAVDAMGPKTDFILEKKNRKK